MSILLLSLTIILSMGTFICCAVSLSTLTSSRSTNIERRSNILENGSSHYDQIVVANTCMKNLENIYQNMEPRPS